MANQKKKKKNPKAQGRDGGDGFGCGSEFPPRIPLFLPNLNLFLNIARVGRKQKLPAPVDPFVLIHGAAGAEGGKSLAQQRRNNIE